MPYFIHYLNNATAAKNANRIGACRSLNISNFSIAISAQSAKILCTKAQLEFPVLVDTENIYFNRGGLINNWQHIKANKILDALFRTSEKIIF